MKKASFLLTIFFSIAIIFSAFSQAEDPVLFTVNDNPVHLSEFNYIYNKNNGTKANYGKESVMEYLDLYQKFKLKVERAKEMKLDTIPALINELAGYRQQLADSYLTDKEVTEKLIKEVYDRQAFDVKVRHIVIRVNPRGTLDQKMQAKEKIEEIKSKIDQGADFKNMARTQSQDVNTKNNGGELNYLTAMLPDGYYQFENAMYSMEVGEVSDIITSNVGYHILQLIDKRPARGTVEAAHILLRKKKRNIPVAGVKEKIDSIYALLKTGADFADLARKHSEDSNSASKGGNVGLFGISTYEKAFEDVAFNITEDGVFSDPVETSLGWHIIKRISKPEKDTYEKARRRLQAQIRKDGRYETAREQMIEDIKVEANLTEDKNALSDFIEGLDKSFYSYQWRVDPLLEGNLFSLGGKNYSVKEFAKYCKDNTRTRLRFNKSAPLVKSINELYDSYVKDQCMKYEEDNLENKYPDFKALMREYEEGILLFEATKMNVWDKASQDTAGLRVFFENHRDDYMWKERADLDTYVIKSSDENLIKKLSKYIKKKNPEEVLAKFNTDDNLMSHSRGKFERGDLELAAMKFKSNSVSDPRPDDKSETVTVRKIVNTYPITPKTLKDARGYIIADYQDHLDKKWVSELREKYDVRINQDILNSIIKSE